MYRKCLSCGLMYSPELNCWVHPSAYEHTVPEISHGLCPNPICKLDLTITTGVNDDITDYLLEEDDEKTKL